MGGWDWPSQFSSLFSFEKAGPHIFFPRYSGFHKYRVKDTPKAVSDACRFFVSQKTVRGLKEAIT